MLLIIFVLGWILATSMAFQFAAFSAHITVPKARSKLCSAHTPVLRKSALFAQADKNSPNKGYWERFVQCIRGDAVVQSTITVTLPAENCNEKGCVQKSPSTTTFSRLSLPSNLPWPTFINNRKQEGAFSTDLYIRRETVCDQTRRVQTLKWLRERFTVAWLGNPGTGKTTDYNDIIRCVLRDLGKESGWMTLVFKNEQRDYVVFTSTNDGEVNIKVNKWVTP